MSKGLFHMYSLVYVIFAYTVMYEFSYLKQQSYQGWIAICILVVLGVLLMKPVQAIASKAGQLNKFVKIIIFVENIAVLIAACRYENDLLIALSGLLIVSITILIGSRKWKMRDQRL
ncbi:hypothetical protein EHV15_34670 [Paenibacillus oralis]|uniref:Uncharacterized protein n=1 Tax=Paenibacillus oralis TaxID=2490856 RepID=A0A3P3T9X0_9BACL|nr:hypothetical protein [Paenibacillus oralis]RRJ54742.1 hypothetical protein EHV15_34670 [Paenibacillus oralis]